MYIKLTMMNLNRSLSNYMIYMFTFSTLLLIMIISNIISVLGNLSFGFQTASLPLIIAIISIIITRYINKFMLNQRSKEFANYLLLGMEKVKLSNLFSMEIVLVGTICMLFAYCIGLLVMLSLSALGKMNFASIAPQVSIISFIWFIFIEVFCILFVMFEFRKLEISELMIESTKNYRFKKNKNSNFSLTVFFISATFCLFLFIGMSSSSEELKQVSVSLISVPFLATIFAFYSLLFQVFDKIRNNIKYSLNKKDRLYILSTMTNNHKYQFVLNSIYCICLFFSNFALIFAMICFFSKNFQMIFLESRWMGIMQLCLSLTFIILYFSTISFKHMIEFKSQFHNYKILINLGRNKSQIYKIIMKQILISLFIPSLYFFIVTISMAITSLLPILKFPSSLGSIIFYSFTLFVCIYAFVSILYIIILFLSVKRLINSDAMLVSI